jgi:hypothetical protein
MRIGVRFKAHRTGYLNFKGNVVKCPKCNSESISKVNPLIDVGAGVAAGAAMGSVFPVIGTALGGIFGGLLTGLKTKHHTLQVYHKCGACGRKF